MGFEYPLSSHRVCVAVGRPSRADVTASVAALVRAGERFVEIRLDYIATAREGLRAVAETSAAWPDVRVLATCRRAACGGRFAGTVDEELDVLEHAIAAGAWGIDVAIESAEAAAARVDTVRRGACLVISSHDFERTPPLDTVIARLRSVPADVYKIATTARTLNDSVRTLALPGAYPGVPIVGLAMGDLGVATRVLATARGHRWTYAAPDADAVTAPGQISVDRLRCVYRIDAISASTAIVAAVGGRADAHEYAERANLAFRRDGADAVCIPVVVSGMMPAADVWDAAHALPVDAIVLAGPLGNILPRQRGCRVGDASSSALIGRDA